jgi:formylglycine-generating enzyme
MYDDIQEWCYDFYDDGYYSRSPRKNPKGPEKGNYHEAVVRGTSKRGGDGRPAFTMRFKASLSPDFKSDKIGFRVVMQ